MLFFAGLVGSTLAMGMNPILVVPAIIVGFLVNPHWLRISISIAIAVVVDAIISLDPHARHQFGHFIVPNFLAAWLLIYGIYGMRRVFRSTAS